MDGWNGMQLVWFGRDFFFVLLEELGKGLFDVIWCGHRYCREGGEEVFRACRLWRRM